MNDDRIRKMTDVFCDVLERLAFTFGDPTPKRELPRLHEPCFAAEMTFSGSQSGALALVVPESMCPELAANILGMDKDDEMAVQCVHDALKELLNIICGQLLTAVAGEEPVFDLSVPQTTRCTPEQWAAWFDDPETVAFLVEDSPALLKFSMN